MTSARVTSKGQLVIPAEIRRRHGIHKGTTVAFEDRGDEIVLRPVTPEYFNRYMGILKGKGSLCKELLAERARDTAREDGE